MVRKVRVLGAFFRNFMPTPLRHISRNNQTVVLRSRGNSASQPLVIGSKQGQFSSARGSPPRRPLPTARGSTGPPPRAPTRSVQQQQTTHQREGDLLVRFGIDSTAGRVVARVLVWLIFFQPVYVAFGMELEEPVDPVTPAVEEVVETAPEVEEIQEEVEAEAEEVVTDDTSSDDVNDPDIEDNATEEESDVVNDDANDGEEENTPATEEDVSDETGDETEGVTDDTTDEPVDTNDETGDGADSTTDESNEDTDVTDDETGDDTTSDTEEQTDTTDTESEEANTDETTGDEDGTSEGDDGAGAEDTDTDTEETDTTPNDDSGSSGGGGGSSTEETDESSDEQTEEDATDTTTDEDGDATGTSEDDTSTTGSSEENGNSDMASSSAKRASTTDETTTEETEKSVTGVQNATNKYMFGEGECTLVADGEFYCVAEDIERIVTGDPRVYAEKDREGDREIFYFDGVDVQRVTNNSYDDFAPVFEEETMRIVWQAMVNDRLQVMLYEIPTNTIRQITTTRQNSSNPDIEGDIVVWQEWVDTNWEIMMTDVDNNGTKFEIERLTNNAVHDMFPQAYDGLITWQSERGGSWEVIVYDMRTGKQQALQKDEDTKYENPRFVLLFDSKHENGDVETIGYDLDTGEMMELGTKSNPIPIDPVTPKDETPEAIPREATSSTQVKATGREDDGSDDDVIL